MRVVVDWAILTGCGRLGDKTFERQASICLSDKNEALRLEHPQSEGPVSDYHYLVASGRI